MNVYFPEIYYDHSVKTNRLVWKIFVTVSGIGTLNVMVTPLEYSYNDYPLMSLIDEDFCWDLSFREIVNQIEMKIFSKIGQTLELPFIFDGYEDHFGHSPSRFSGIAEFMCRRRI